MRIMRVKYYVLGIMGSALLYLPLMLSTIPYSRAFDLASTYSVADREAKSGDILTQDSQKGLIRASVSYDGHLFGVLSDEALVVYKSKDATSSAAANEHPVTRTGDVTVNVTDFNGLIKQGDYITSSPIPGKGMKATQTGYVIGLATSNITTSDKITFGGKQYNSGTIQVALNIQYAEISTPRSTLSFLSALNTAFFRNIQDPEKFTLVIRYIIAGIITILALALGFFTFSRSVAKGIEAIGRNPLAKNTIQVTIGVQIFLTIFTTLAAVVLAIVIVRI